MWNQKEFTAPALCLQRAKTGVYKKDVHGTWSAMEKFVTHCSAVIPYLTIEQHILTRSIYKYNLSMRREKCLGYLKQVKKCLNSFIAIAPHETVVNLLDVWPSPDDARIADDCVYVPSRQTVQYVLFRLQGATKLLERMLIQTMLSYSEALQQIHSGMIIHSMIVFASISSRIWFLCCSLLKSVITVYPNIYTAMLELEGKDLGGSDTLPQNLEEVLETSLTNLEMYSEEFERNKSAVDSLLEKYGITTQNRSDNSIHEDPSITSEGTISPVGPSKIETNRPNLIEDIGSPMVSIELNKVKTKKSKKTKRGEDRSVTLDSSKVLEDIGSPVIREEHPDKNHRKLQKEKKKSKDSLNDDFEYDQSGMDMSESKPSKAKNKIQKKKQNRQNKIDKSEKGRNKKLKKKNKVEQKSISPSNCSKTSPSSNVESFGTKRTKYISEIKNIRKLSALKALFENVHPKIKAKNDKQYVKCSKKLNCFSRVYKSAAKEERKKMFKKSKIILCNFFKQPRNKS